MPHHSPTESAPKTAGRVLHWHARFYDATTWLMSFGRERAMRQMTLDLADVRPGEAILDVGCGTGTLTIAAKAAAGRDGKVAGIDPAPEMIAGSRRKAGKAGAEIDFQVGVIEELPYPDGSFDLLLSSLMLHHLPDEVKRRGFAEIHRVLRPGGRFLAVDLVGSQGPLGHILTLLLGRHTSGAGLNDLAPMLEAAGFTDVETGPTPKGPLGFLRARRP